MNINIISSNIRGLNDPFKLNKTILFFKQSKHDVILLQETKLKAIPDIHWSGSSFFSTSSTASAGVAILLKNNISSRPPVLHLMDSRMIIISFTALSGMKLGIVNLYAPNDESERMYFFQKLDELILEFSPQWDELIIGGDLNTPPSHFLINQLLQNWDLKLLKNDKIRFTFDNGRSRTLIDHIFCSAEMASTASLTIGPKLSDHFSLQCSIQLVKSSLLGNFTYWKLNAALLNNERKQLHPTLVTFLDKELQDMKTIQNYSSSTLMAYWDSSIKPNIKNFFIEKGLEFAGKKNNPFEQLLQISEEIQKVHSQITDFNQVKITEFFSKVDSPITSFSSPRPPRSSSSITSQKNQLLERLVLLEEFRENTQKDILKNLVAKEKFFQLMAYEKPTKLFFGLEKQKMKSHVIPCLQSISSDDRPTIGKGQDICNEFKLFYNNLFNQRKDEFTTSKGLLFSSFVQQLNEHEKETINTPITIEEIELAIMSTFNGGSPGLDGITYEFYKAYSNSAIPLLHLLFNSIMENNGMLFPESFKYGLIKVIPKDIPPLTIPTVKDFRPISLTNCDFKIFSKIIVNRLKSFFPSLISSAQHGLPGRKIINAILQTADAKGTSLNIDFEKAFDSISKIYLRRIVSKTNMGRLGLVIANLFLAPMFSQVSVNGFISDPFPISNGVRQGDPLSPFLFCLGLNPLLCLLQEKGIHSVAYMDDLNIFPENWHQMDFTLKILKRFYNESNLKNNPNKSYFFPSPPPSPPPSLTLDDPLTPNNQGFQVKNASIYLGVPLAPHVSSFITQTWMDKLKACNNSLSLWKKHKLSLKGKTLIWNSLIISKFIHMGFISPPPPTFFSQLDYLLKDFLWEKKTHLLSLEKLYLPLKKGGLGLINLKSHLQVLKCITLKDLISNPLPSFSLAHKSLNLPSAKQFIQLQSLAKKVAPTPNSKIRESSNLSSLQPHYLSLWASLASTPFDSWPKNNKEARWLIDKHSLGEVPLYYQDLDAGCTKAFAGLWKAPVPQKWNQTFFLFLHRALPLSDRMHRKDFSQCHLCLQNDTFMDHRHVFLNCPFSTSLLSSALSTMGKPQQNLTRFILRGGRVGSTIDVSLQKLHRFWMNIIWKSHLAHYLKNESVSSLLLLSHSSLSFMISNYISKMNL